MLSEELELSNLEIYHQRVDLIQATADQIIKDFAIFGHEIQFSGVPEKAYRELYIQVEKIVYKLITDDFHQLMSILYRIDIDEKTLKMNLASTHEDSSELLAQLIIERELKKVIIRWYYSGKL